MKTRIIVVHQFVDLTPHPKYNVEYLEKDVWKYYNIYNEYKVACARAKRLSKWLDIDLDKGEIALFEDGEEI